MVIFLPAATVPVKVTSTDTWLAALWYAITECTKG
jgi:hypothetical protein